MGLDLSFRHGAIILIRGASSGLCQTTLPNVDTFIQTLDQAVNERFLKHCDWKLRKHKKLKGEEFIRVIKTKLTNTGKMPAGKKYAAKLVLGCEFWRLQKNAISV